MELDAETKGGMEKAQVSATGKYLVTAFLVSLDRRQYGELILLLKNEYAKQQKKYLKTLTDMYGLMVVFFSNHTQTFYPLLDSLGNPTKALLG